MRFSILFACRLMALDFTQGPKIISHVPTQHRGRSRSSHYVIHRLLMSGSLNSWVLVGLDDFKGFVKGAVHPKFLFSAVYISREFFMRVQALGHAFPHQCTGYQCSKTASKHRQHGTKLSKYGAPNFKSQGQAKRKWVKGGPIVWEEQPM